MVNMKDYIVRRQEDKIGAKSQHDMFIERKDGNDIDFDELKDLYGHIVPKINDKFDVDELVSAGLRKDGIMNIKGYGSTIQETLDNLDEYLNGKVAVQSKFRSVRSMTISWLTS